MAYRTKAEEEKRIARNKRQNALRAARKAARTPEERAEILKTRRIKDAARRARERGEA